MQDANTIISNLENHLNSLVSKALEVKSADPEQAAFLCQSALNLATIIVHEAGIEINWNTRDAFINSKVFKHHPFVESLLKGKAIKPEQTKESMHVVHNYCVIRPVRVSANGEMLWYEKNGEKLKVGKKKREYTQSFDMMLNEFAEPQAWAEGEAYLVYFEMFDDGKIKFTHEEGYWNHIQKLDEGTAAFVTKWLKTEVNLWRKAGNTY